MSDIAISIPFWLLLVLFAGVYWYVTLAIAAVIAAVGLLFRRVWRWLIVGVAGLVAASAVVWPVMGWVEDVQSARDAAAEARLHVTLGEARSIEGLDLPAGTRVQFADAAHTRVFTADLPGPSRLLGVQLVGQITREADAWWTVTLAGPEVIDGWPCRAGEAWLSDAGRLERCTLGAERAWQGHVFPAGTDATLTPARGDQGSFTLPADREMAVPEIGAVLPGGGLLQTREDGRVERLYVQDEERPMVVRGVPLIWDLYFRYEGVDGAGALRLVTSTLGRDFAGLTGGTAVKVDLLDGRVMPLE